MKLEKLYDERKKGEKLVGEERADILNGLIDFYEKQDTSKKILFLDMVSSEVKDTIVEVSLARVL